MNNLALAYHQLGEREIDLRLYERAVDLAQKVYRAAHPNLAGVYNLLGKSGAYALFGSTPEINSPHQGALPRSK